MSLIIRNEQLKVLRENQNRLFRDRILAFLVEEHGEALVRIPEGDRRSLVEEGIARARDEYGLRSQASVCWFVTMMVEVSPRFDKQEKIHQYLIDDEINSDERVMLVLEDCTESDWAAAGES